MVEGAGVLIHLGRTRVDAFLRLLLSPPACRCRDLRSVTTPSAARRRRHLVIIISLRGRAPFFFSFCCNSYRETGLSFFTVTDSVIPSAVYCEQPPLQWSSSSSSFLSFDCFFFLYLTDRPTTIEQQKHDDLLLCISPKNNLNCFVCVSVLIFACTVFFFFFARAHSAYNRHDTTNGSLSSLSAPCILSTKK